MSLGKSMTWGAKNLKAKLDTKFKIRTLDIVVDQGILLNSASFSPLPVFVDTSECFVPTESNQLEKNKCMVQYR